MSLSKLAYALLYVVVLTICGSCANLHHIGEFSNTSLQSLEKYDDISYDFEKNCEQECLQKHMAGLQIHNTSCACDMDQKADSITRILYGTTLDYFQALSDISNNELTQYQTGDLTMAAGTLGVIDLSENQVQAYSDLSTLLVRAFTDGYRRKSIKKFVTEGDSALQTLLRYLDLNLAGNLHGKLEVRKQRLKAFYFDHVANERLSNFERTKFVEDYFARVSAIEKKQRELEAYSDLLVEIGEAHSDLSDHIGKLTKEELKVLLAQHGSHLKGTLRVFNGIGD